MKLNFLGVGSAFTPLLGNTAACFWRQDTLYVIDCGGLAFAKLAGMEGLAKAKRVVVLLTHCHADHIGGLGTLISFCKHVLHVPVKVVHPRDTAVNVLTLMGIAPTDYDAAMGEAYVDAHLVCTFVPVRHSDKTPCYGIKIKDGQTTIFYSGDAEAVPESILEAFLAGEIARVYQDTAFGEAPQAGHGHYAAFCRLIPLSDRARFYPIHWNVDAKAQLEKDGFGIVDRLP